MRTHHGLVISFLYKRVASIAFVVSVLVTSAHGVEWTWVGGSDDMSQYGTYGILGTPNVANAPGCRYGAVTWTDGSGDLWLFGGYGLGASGGGLLNDLWKYDITAGHWTWMKGSNAPDQHGTYGTKGIASSGNTPGARQNAVSWKDGSGNLWLFGGVGQPASGAVNYLNDLWKYDVASGNWTWMKGSNATNEYGTYGTRGEPVPDNTPGARQATEAWTDLSGNLWLFGGSGFATSGLAGFLNDLWRYDVATGNWAWMKGSNAIGQLGVYGSLGVEETSNTAGARSGAVTWTDSSGHLWLFGGYGYPASGTTGYLNDLWRYDVGSGNWAWIKGSAGKDQVGTFGTIGVEDSLNVPGARDGAVSWTDRWGNLWLFGGYGFGAVDTGRLNDAWKLDVGTRNWTWMKGSSTAVDQNGTYGTKGTPAEANAPGGREMAASWADGSGDLWLFGGTGFPASAGPGDLNDLWRMTPVEPPLQYSLTVGTVHCTVIKSPGQTDFEYGTTVTLTVTPDANYDFASWSGDVPGGHETDNPLQLLMDGDKSLTASCEHVPVPVSGTITCGGMGVADVELQGAPVTVATDSSGDYSFPVPFGWGGTIEPRKPGYTFTPPTRTLTNVNVPQAGLDFSATSCTEALKVDSFTTEPTWQYSGHGRLGAGGMEYNYDDAAQALRMRVYSSNTLPDGSAKRARMGGWYTTQQQDWLPYSAVSSDNYVRGKFYVYSYGQAHPAQRNEIPVFQCRLSSRFAFTSNLEVTPHNNTLPGTEPMLGELAPTTDSLHPSVYRVDYDPPDVTYYDTHPDEGLWGSISAFCTDPQDNGYLCLTECAIGIYPAATMPDSPTSLLKAYRAADGDLARFAGYSNRYNVKFAEGTTDGGYPSEADTTSTYRIAISVASTGVTYNSSAVPTDWVGIATHYLHPTRNGALAWSTVPRVSPGKQYKMRFHLTGTQNSNRQCPFWLYGYTLGFGYGVKIEMGGAFGVDDPGDPTNQLAWQMMPGVGSQVTDGWYNLLFVTPMHPDVRAEFTSGEPIEQRMPVIMSRPGPGANVDSDCNIGSGVIMIDTLNYGAPNALLESGDIMLDTVEVREYDLVPD